MKIAVTGIRGVPVSYSTFETFAEVLGAELVNREHSVSIYCRSKYVESDKKKYRGIIQVILPSIETKHLSTFTHTLLSTVHACLFAKYDLILYLGVGNTIFSIFPRLFGAKTVVHIDGLDWERKKWGRIARQFLKASLFLTNLFPDAVISDNPFMVDYYRKKYNKNIKDIPYGYFSQKLPSAMNLLKKYGLTKRGYFVWVGRLVPENNIEELIYALKRIKDNTKCLIIGDDLYENTYKTKIYELIERDRRLVKTGFIKHEDVLTLVANAAAYIETKRIGGTQMALIEAMGTGVLVVSNDHVAHRNVLGDAALYYDEQKGYRALVRVLQHICNGDKKRFNDLRIKVKERAIAHYTWDNVIIMYEKYFFYIVNKSRK